MVDRTFDFGSFQVRALLKGLLDEQPAFEITVSVPSGRSETSLQAVTRPLPSEAALFVVEQMRRILKMGPQRFAQFRMMREQRKPEERVEIQRDAARVHAVATSIPGGDAALAQAEAELRQEVEREAAEETVEAEKAAQAAQESGKIGFDLGPVRIVVESAGAIEAPGRAPLAAFRLTAVTPDNRVHVANVATDAPFFSGAAEWLLGQFEEVLRLGPEGFVAQETAKGQAQGTPEEAAAYAATLHSMASALGPAGIAQAHEILEQAKAQEMWDFEEIQLKVLEEERKEIRRQIERMRGRRRPK